VVVHFPFLDGPSLTVFLKDPERTAARLHACRRGMRKRSGAWRPARARVAALAPAERANSPEGLFFQRLDVLSGYDAARQVWESPVMQAVQSLGRQVARRTRERCRYRGTSRSRMMDHMAGRPMPKGGSGMLSVALGRFIEAHNGVILTGKPVAQLIIENRKCTGRGVRGRQQVPGAESGSLHDSRQAPLGNGAKRTVGAMRYTRAWISGKRSIGMFVFHYAFSEPPKYPLADGGTRIRRRSVDHAAAGEHLRAERRP